MSVLLIRSARAFSCGVYGVVGLSSMPLLLSSSYTVRARYSLALSGTRRLGYCWYCAAVCSIALIMVTGTCVRFFIQYTDMYLVAVSISAMK